jgi:hypothetical protein
MTEYTVSKEEYEYFKKPHLIRVRVRPITCMPLVMDGKPLCCTLGVFEPCGEKKE